MKIAESEAEFTAIRAGGPGGQHVNKVATAVQLRFDIARSSLPAASKQRLLSSHDRRIGGDGIITIKAQRFRSQEKNRRDALQRLCDMLIKAATSPRKRIATRPPKAAKERRLREKKLTGGRKSGRAVVKDLD